MLSYHQILLTFLALAATASATLAPCISNTKGKCPGTVHCSPARVSKAIQAAECAHNTRVYGVQTFAVFVAEEKYSTYHGAPYGTCTAYTCKAPTHAEMTKSDVNCWTFFWNHNGEKSGMDTGCIKNSRTGECGCEYSNGTFVSGSDSCV